MEKWKILYDRFLKNPRKMLVNMLIIFLIGVLLILIGDISSSMLGSRENKDNGTIETGAPVGAASKRISDTGTGLTTYEEKMRQELIDTLKQIQGVGRVTAMISYEGGEQTIPAFNTIDSSKRTDEKDAEGGIRTTTETSRNQEVVTGNGENTGASMVVRHVNPKVSGVVVVAEGAGNPTVKERLFQAVKTVLSLSGNKVSILPMKSEQ